jgi:dipeptidyl aminopeptidase/acylaminoacyl peptidase
MRVDPSTPRSMDSRLQALLELRQAYPLSFSADGSTLLVASDLPGTRQLFTLSSDGGELVQLTDLPEPVDGVFMPDGRVLLAVDEGGNERTQLHVLGEGPLVVDQRFIHRVPALSRDGSLLAYSTNRRNGIDFDVIVRTLATGEERAFELGGLWANGAFSPDGGWLVATRRGELSGDDDLYLLGTAGGEVIHATPHEGQAGYVTPVWTADGAGLFAATNEGRDTFAIARLDLATRAWEVIAESRWDLECAADDAGRLLLVVANEDGFSRLELRDPATLDLQEEIELPGRGVAEHFVFSADGSRLAFAFSTATEPHQVFFHEPRSGEPPRKLTDLGAVEGGVEPSVHRVESFDGEEVPVFLFEPEGGGPFPVVVTVHGGPEGQWRPWYSQGFGPLTQFLVSRGYAVAAPNVRGSTGYGKRFEHLDDVELRLDSVHDLAAVHGWLAARPGIDGSRVAVYGRSYGGYMVLAALAFQPELWAAGIDFVGISSLRTFLENTADWRRAAREREYGSLADPELLERLSPSSRVDAIRAPLFIEHGRNDPRVPVSESEHIHRVLVERGIRCELVIYEDEGHMIEKLGNRLDAFERAAAFLDEVLA